ncbi:MAG: hypothetical protein ABSC23_03805 [Bryobacteraceae bacterium]|jgi:hypothetical protein
MDIAPLVAAGISILASGIAGLIAWGLKGEVSTLRAENETLRTEVRGDVALFRSDMATLRAEVRASIAEGANAFFVRVNGAYVKKDVCRAVHTATEDRLIKIEQSVEGMG